MKVNTLSKQRLDHQLVQAGLVGSRSQAESYIKLGQVTVNGQIVTKPGQLVRPDDRLKVAAEQQYVSRAGLKLAAAADQLGLQLNNKIVLDVGSSTGGFTDYALRHGAKQVIAVDVGTNQLHPMLHHDSRIELHEKTDIRDFRPSVTPDVVVIDVSFISLRAILPHITSIIDAQTAVIAMCKPQFEAGQASLKHKGVIKNDALRRQILKDFEQWVKQLFVIENKADSAVPGAKGNRERFYRLYRTFDSK